MHLRATSVTTKAVLAWLALLAAMFTNGAFRAAVLQPRLGEDAARQLASLTGLAVVLTASGLFVHRVPQAGRGTLLRIGVLWLVLTLGFEFLFGHFVSGLSWGALLEDYDLLRGRLWVLVLLGVLFGPWAWGVLRGGRGYVASAASPAHPDDVAAVLAEAIREARVAGLRDAADELEARTRSAVTTSSEWLGEVGLAIRRFEEREHGRVPAVVQQRFDACKAVVGRTWPGLG